MMGSGLGHKDTKHKSGLGANPCIVGAENDLTNIAHRPTAKTTKASTHKATPVII